MQKGDVGLVLGLAGFLLGAYAVYAVTGQGARIENVENTQKHDGDGITGLGEKVERLDTSVKDVTRRVNGLDANPRTMSDRFRAIEERLDAVEKSGAGAGGDFSSTVNAKPAPKASLTPEEVEDLRKKVFSGQATADETAAYFAALREHPEILGDAMKEMEKKVAESPNDATARMNLARLYIAKLLTVPSGPEMGAWSMKAMGQYEKILEQDPNHWDARYSLAFNWSQWPDFLNKRPDAIKQFETLAKIQETQAAEPKHAQTYLQLRQLYLKDGRTDDAKAVLDRGLARFPDDEELKKARDGAK